MTSVLFSHARVPGHPAPAPWPGRSHQDDLYADLAEEALAALVAAGDPAARAEVRRRFAPAATQLARRICARIGHRGATCPGRAWSHRDCDLAFTFVEHDLLDRFAGHDAAGSRRARKSLLVTWSEQRRRPADFATWVRGPGRDGLRGMVSEGRRAWNTARGLKARPYLPVGMREAGAERYALLTAAAPYAADAATLALTGGEAALRAWVDALFEDACETGLQDPIDLHRVARRVTGLAEPGERAEAAVARLAPAVDALLSRHWPEWWDEYLGRPRGLTRAWAPLPPACGGEHWHAA